MANGAARARWFGYFALGGAASALVGPWLVLVLLACGLAEMAARLRARALPSGPGMALPLALVAPGVAGGLLALCWVAIKVGALSFGGGFVIIPLMQHDAVTTYHWMTGAQFLSAVALGQVTPGPVVQTVAVVGYAAAGIGGGLLAALVAFAPSFVFVLGGGRHFDRLRATPPNPGVPRRCRTGGDRGDRRCCRAPRYGARPPVAARPCSVWPRCGSSPRAAAW